MSKAIKLIGLDLDGTTLDRDDNISIATRQAFSYANNKGATVAVATGRAKNSLPSYIWDIEEIKYIITSNGGEIFLGSSGEKIYTDYLKPEDVAPLLKVLEENNKDIEIVTNGQAYISRREFDQVFSRENKIRDREYVIRTRMPVENIFEFGRANIDRIENVNINYHSVEEKEEFFKILLSLENLNITSSFLTNHEVGGRDTSKATALKFLLLREGLTDENLMACGDSPNDLSMIELAKVGVAMENAHPKVLERSDFITKANYEDGVAKAIMKFL